jgi:hypothetical protein
MAFTPPPPSQSSCVVFVLEIYLLVLFCLFSFTRTGDVGRRGVYFIGKTFIWPPPHIISLSPHLYIYRCIHLYSVREVREREREKKHHNNSLSKYILSKRPTKKRRRNLYIFVCLCNLWKERASAMFLFCFVSFIF